MLQRTTRAAIARLILGALFFSQAAIAAASCDMPDRSPARVFTQPAPMPCHEEPGQNANICLAHCLSSDQSADTPQFAVPVWIDAAPLIVVFSDRWSAHAPIIAFVLPRPAAPPPRILFQSFQI